MRPLPPVCAAMARRLKAVKPPEVGESAFLRSAGERKWLVECQLRPQRTFESVARTRRGITRTSQNARMAGCLLRHNRGHRLNELVCGNA